MLFFPFETIIYKIQNKQLSEMEDKKYVYSILTLKPDCHSVDLRLIIMLITIPISLIQSLCKIYA